MGRLRINVQRNFNMRLLKDEITDRAEPSEGYLAGGHADHSSERTSDLKQLLGNVAEFIRNPTSSQAKTLERIAVLRERLKTERFQLAALGQFKRGKSTVLNALLGKSVLPTGVVPVTAIATFLEPSSDWRVRVTYRSGKIDNFELSGADAACECLTKYVTEDSNPRNALNVARVEVFLPSEFLQRGVILIDTPGVGSTHRHNTAAADAVLPECDAALFVVSADPPITEVELEYLARIRKTAARVIVVLNKIDIVESHEHETATAFLRGVLVDHAGLDPFTPIFGLSARRGLEAKQAGETEALKTSGLAELERHLVKFLATEKQEALSAAVARKAVALLGQLQLETEIALKSLRLPLEDLQQRMNTFEEAVKRFEVERQTANDLLAGDRNRALHELEAEAKRLRTEARTALERELDKALSADKRAEDARKLLSQTVVTFFDDALQDVIEKVSERLTEMLRVHQRRTDELITLVRQTAANLLEIPFRAPESSEAFEAKRDPFWVTTMRTAELNPVPPGAFDRLLPAPIRNKRMRKRLLEEIEAVVIRNVENLRWATRQNLEDTFRRFSAELDERLAMSLTATRGAMEKALNQRREHSEQIDSEVESKQTALSRLAEISDALARLQ